MVSDRAVECEQGDSCYRFVNPDLVETIWWYRLMLIVRQLLVYIFSHSYCNSMYNSNQVVMEVGKKIQKKANVTGAKWEMGREKDQRGLQDQAESDEGGKLLYNPGVLSKH